MESIVKSWSNSKEYSELDIVKFDNYLYMLTNPGGPNNPIKVTSIEELPIKKMAIRYDGAVRSTVGLVSKLLTELGYDKDANITNNWRRIG